MYTFNYYHTTGKGAGEGEEELHQVNSDTRWPWRSGGAEVGDIVAMEKWWSGGRPHGSFLDDMIAFYTTVTVTKDDNDNDNLTSVSSSNLWNAYMVIKIIRWRIRCIAD